MNPEITLYQAIEADSVLKRMTLTSLPDNEISIKLKIKPTHYHEILRQMLSAITQPTSSEIANNIIRIRAPITNTETFNSFFHAALSAIGRYENVERITTQVISAFPTLTNVTNVITNHTMDLNELPQGSGAWRHTHGTRLIGDLVTDRSSQRIHFHGHESQTRQNSNIRNLDNTLGYHEDPITRVQQASFAEHYGHTSATFLPSRTSTPQHEITEDEYKDFKVAEIEGYTCPISLEIMTDPVSIKGHETSGTFERSAIENWLRVKNTHPLTNQIVTDKTLVPNTELQKAIEDFKKSSAKNNQNPS